MKSLRITINKDLLDSFNLNPAEYVYLYLLFFASGDDKEYLEKIEKDCPDIIQALEKKMFVKNTGDKIIPREKTLELFNFSIKVEDWIQDFRDVFKGARKIKSMGDKQKCIKNMKWFLENYPNYTKDDIIGAAIRYINYKKQTGEPCRQADYFIKKQEDDDGNVIVSDLLSILEDIESGSNIPNNKTEQGFKISL